MPLKSKLPSLTPASERLKKSITLISHGYSLKPEIQDGVITVYPWDSEVSQWVISAERGSNDYDFIIRVAKKLLRCPDAVLHKMVASELLVVMLVARSLVNSGNLSYTAKCPHCKAVQAKSQVTVPDNLGKIGEKENDYRGWDEVTLPESGDAVKLRSPLVLDVINAFSKGIKDVSETGLLNAVSIMAVNDTMPDDFNELVKYYLALPPNDASFIRKYMNDHSPALDTKIPHECDQCNKPFSYDLALSYDFFL